jgi:hypothetical protein
MRIRTKLLVPFLVLPLGSIAVLGFLVYRGGRETIASSLGLLFELEAVRVIEALDREVLALYGDALAWAANDRMQDVLSDDLDGRVSSFLVAEARAQPHLRRAVVADVAGRVVAASHPDRIGTVVRAAGAGYDDSGLACRADGGSEDEARLLLTCSFPIRAHFDERQVIGTLTVAWDLIPVFERLHSEARLVHGQAGLVLVTRDGIVASVPSSRPEGILHRPVEAALATTLNGGRRRGHLVERMGGQRHLVGFAHSSSPVGWSVLVV